MDAMIPSIDLSIVPAGTPPPGVVPNFIDPPSIAWLGRLSVYIALPLMIILLALRLYVRLRVTCAAGADDCMPKNTKSVRRDWQC